MTTITNTTTSPSMPIEPTLNFYGAHIAASQAEGIQADVERCIHLAQEGHHAEALQNLRQLEQQAGALLPEAYHALLHHIRDALQPQVQRLLESGDVHAAKQIIRAACQEASLPERALGDLHRLVNTARRAPYEPLLAEVLRLHAAGSLPLGCALRMLDMLAYSADLRLDASIRELKRQAHAARASQPVKA